MTEPESGFARTIMQQKYSHTKPDGSLETWEETARRVATNVMGAVTNDDQLTNSVYEAIRDRKFMPGGRYLYASGRPMHQTQNCLLLRAEDSREGWADLMYKASMALMTGAGIGVDYSEVRPEGSPIAGTGGTATGPLALAQIVNEAGRHIMQGGARRSAIWAGLHWSHEDCVKFCRIKDWNKEVRKLKEQDFNFPATLDGTNISVILDREFFDAYNDKQHPKHAHAHFVYWLTVEKMLKTAEPGFSVDYHNPRESLRNACTEVVSEDDSDICNLGSINLARVSSLDEMRHLVTLGTKFLMAGTVYSHVPYDKVATVRESNRRLGLGLMGIHEWLLTKGRSYGVDSELEQYLQVYTESDKVATDTAKQWKLSVPIATRAIAPTGTIGIIAETTTGIEPIFCVAYKRRYLKHKTWHYQYVVDPTAKRLVDAGVNPELIEDAYTLSADVERRVKFQAWVQKFVDQSISSTVNLPAFNAGTDVQGFGTMLLKYLPQLRGITVYPDGARGGQPLTPVKLATAMKHLGEVHVEGADLCDITGKGSCNA